MTSKKYDIFFLDRDGVISENRFVNSPEDFEFLPKSLEALRILRDTRTTVFIATNQGGIEAGYINEETLQNIHNNILDEITKTGGHIKEIFHCPHLDTKCECRKPKPGMIIKALKKYNLQENRSKCCFIGDHLTDWQAAIAAGIDPIAVQSPRYWDKEAYRFINEHKIPFHYNLYQAVLSHAKVSVHTYIG